MEQQFKELREYLDGRFGKIDERFAQIDGQLKQIEERDLLLRSYVEERFNQIHEYIDERTHDTETRLLTAFQRWATRIEATIKPLPFRMGGHEERIAMIEERLKDPNNPLS